MSDKTAILCVDDEQKILRLLRLQLTTEGYTVLTALNGAEGLALLEKNHVDLIIADQRMPVMSGSELLRAVRQKYPDIIRIMMSGYSDFDSLVRAVNEGEIFRFISKPWEMKNLSEIIRLALGQRDVVQNVGRIVESVIQLAKVPNKVSISHSHDDHTLTLRITDPEDVLPSKSVHDLLDQLVRSLGMKDTAVLSAGTIKKEAGVLEMTIDVGKGVCLRIQYYAPHAQTDAASHA